MATPASTVAGTRVVKIGDASLEVRTRATRTTRARDGATTRTARTRAMGD